MRQAQVTYTLAAILVAALGGCAKSPEAKETGFLSDYSKLRPVDDKRMHYSSPQIREYQAFIIEPVEFRTPPKALNKNERAEVASHFRSRFADLVKKRGLTVTDTPGPGVARVRLAMTGVAQSTWWMKVHPVSRASGAGTGGAAMEGEVVDSVTGEQLGAVVQASPGNQFNFTAFSTVADVKSAIDKWVDQAGRRLDEIRAGRDAASAQPIAGTPGTV
jgi:hypothetical protein